MMPPDDSSLPITRESPDNDLESSLFGRVRQWTDLLGWIRLGRTLRVAASPPMMLAVTAAMLVMAVGERLVIGSSPFFDGVSGLEFWQTLRFREGHASGTIAIGLWRALIGAPVAMLVARQGSLLTAGRPMVGLKTGASFVLKRTPQAWIAAVMPVLCALAIGLGLLLIGGMGHLIEGFGFLETTMGWIAALIAIPAGVLMFGSLFAVPLAWAALANEPDPDPLDALSRGYEYLYRRPVQLALYLVMATALIALIGTLAWGVAVATCIIATIVLSFANAPAELITAAESVCVRIPVIVIITTSWSLIGGVYLLLRQDAGGQEVEDLWVPAPAPAPSLPELP